MPVQRTAQARFYLEEVLPVTVFQILEDCAGESAFLSEGGVQCLVVWHQLFAQPLIGGVQFSPLLRLGLPLIFLTEVKR